MASEPTRTTDAPPKTSELRPREEESQATSAEATHPPESEALPPEPSDTPGPALPQARAVVGIGASAGGLEALSAFLDAVPPDSGAAFVVVAHLSPDFESNLTALLQRHTAMEVVEIRNEMRVRPNVVHVIPPDRHVVIEEDVLLLTRPRKPRAANLPIDRFLRSLAESLGPAAICIILSGTGSDGSDGLRAVKGAAGLTLAQDAGSARYDGMPRSAAATGLADYVLPPEDMPAALLRYLDYSPRARVASARSESGPTAMAMDAIFARLRTCSDVDFSLYKANTICRRIERRMNIHQLADLDDYVRYLRESEHEVQVLARELLIGVTNFFRDPDAFASLAERALPLILDPTDANRSVRVWVPGCSTGEEAYSLAILLREYMELHGPHRHIQIFATDVDAEAIETARAAVYPGAIAADVGPERLARYFTKEQNGRLRVKKSLRDMLVFAPHNVLTDPPFTKLHLLSCRNLLIYLGAELQQRLLPAFHFSLRPGGFLFLGASETIGSATDYFESLDGKWKIYRRRSTANSARDVLRVRGHAGRGRPEPMTATTSRAPRGEISKAQLVETILRQSAAPPGVVVDETGDIIYIHGRTGRFLEPAEGVADLNVLKMARPGLRNELNIALRLAVRKREKVLRPGLRIPHDGGQSHVDVSVEPIRETGLRNLLLVLFLDAPQEPSAGPGEPGAVEPPGVLTAAQLEEELHRTRETLQTSVEELQTSNEELESLNEELQSTNEELQSTNEEMETSKEELQSLNEEATTVIAQMQSRIDELSEANDDMRNLLDSTEIATIFLGSDLCVRRFTPRATDIVPLTTGDSGRPIAHLASRLKNVDLSAIAAAVLDDLVTREVAVTSVTGRSYRLRVRPYRTVANVIDGVVVTFEDTTASLELSAGLREIEAVLRRVLDVVQESVVLVAESRTIRFLGHPSPIFHRHAAVGDPYLGALHAELRECVGRAVEEVFASAPARSVACVDTAGRAYEVQVIPLRHDDTVREVVLLCPRESGADEPAPAQEEGELEA